MARRDPDFGRVPPIENSTVGWSYSAFTDAAYFEDYDFDTADWTVNEVYATHLSEDFYADIRLQRVPDARAVSHRPAPLKTRRIQQAVTLPNARGARLFRSRRLGARCATTGSLIGVHRDMNSSDTLRGVLGYVFGYEGTKTHAERRIELAKAVHHRAACIVVTPYLGLRADLTDYDRSDGPRRWSRLSPEPDEQLLFAATPIAAIDVRWPLMASNWLRSPPAGAHCAAGLSRQRHDGGRRHQRQRAQFRAR